MGTLVGRWRASLHRYLVLDFAIYLIVDSLLFVLDTSLTGTDMLFVSCLSFSFMYQLGNVRLDIFILVVYGTIFLGYITLTLVTHSTTQKQTKQDR